MEWNEEPLTLSPCETHHLKKGNPFYGKRFKKVLSYHPPGVAAVWDEEGAYHIDTQGWPLYPQRYIQSFGYYEDRAATEDSKGWFHIRLDGTPAYKKRFAWCGNFQEGACIVCTPEGNYFHINDQGRPLYDERYAYVGDFKYGSAVICDSVRGCTHIDSCGQFLHSLWFIQLDVFHKGYARARDHRGWFHITRNGEQAYTERYAMVEPFYNGLAYVEDAAGRHLIINEQGAEIRLIQKAPPRNAASALSGDMVGFWRTWALRAAVDLRIPDILPASLENIATQSGLMVSKAKRLLKALWELNIVEPLADKTWHLTEKGKLLSPTSQSYLAAATYMWGRVNALWEHLSEGLRESETLYAPSFKEQERDPQALLHYQRALEGYAIQDFEPVARMPLWQNIQSLCVVGKYGDTLNALFSQNHPRLKLELINHASSASALSSPIPPNQKAILFPRFLHYFPNKEALMLLKKAKDALKSSGNIYILEMILDETSPMGGLFDLNMLVETGGQVRTHEDWKRLLAGSGLKIDELHELSPVLTLLKAVSV